MSMVLRVTALSFALSCALPLSARAAPRLWLVSSLDGKPPTPSWKYARLGQQVELSAVLEPEVKGAKFEWFKLEPKDPFADNTQPSFHFVPIHYEAIEIAACRGRSVCPADVTASRSSAPVLAGVGTMAFQVAATLPDGSRLSTPGLEAVKYGGLTRAVHRVTFRRDDTYLGYLTELFNTPYIFGSAGPDGRNQTDLLIGSDCADLAVYGQRRLGRKVAYTSSYGIEKPAPEVARAASLTEQGAARDDMGRAITYGPGKGQVAVGDVLHFPNSRHVAVLYEDREPLGVLDANDLMLHTCWAPPAVEPLSANPRCVSLPWRVLRFK